ncbi:MAG: DUF937 domain-containing protein [Hyphomicrobiales bacterium]|nr:DUF937 domain-containing protein [Hyphomicrobiales bacterium]
MGLADVLTGMMNGPRGQRQPSSGGGGGMSPIMIALLGLLAYKAFKGRGGQTAPSGGVGQTGRLPPGGTPSAGGSGGDVGDILGGLFGGKPGSMPSGSGAKPGGSLSDLFPGGLGGVLGGAAAGSVLSGGLGNIIKELQDGGHGRVAQSWVGTGPNEEIAPKDLANALGSDTLNALSKQTGLSVDELLAGLSQHLPDLVDQLTPNGRLPTHEEAARMV